MTNPNVRPDLEALKVLQERLTSQEHRGQYTLGGCIVRNDGTSESWGGEKILVARNPDGAKAAGAINDLIAHIERLQNALKPFAEAKVANTTARGDDCWALGVTGLTLGHIREARATLSQGTSNE